MMAFCPGCGASVLDADRFCPGCGSKTHVTQASDATRAKKIETGINTAGDIGAAIISLPFAIFGMAFMFAAIVVAIGAISRSPWYALIGGIWGLIIGGICFAIGNFFVKRMENETVKTWTMGIGLLGGIIGAIYIYPGYAMMVAAFY